MTTKEELLEKQYETVGHEGRGFTEIRLLPEGISIFCDSQESFVREASKYLDRDTYVGINPRSTKSGTANDIFNLTTLVVDIDPVRPKDTGSSAPQLAASIALGDRIRDDFGGGITVSSGSGCHVYLPIQPVEVVNREVLSESLRTWCNTIKKTYGTKEFKIDSIWDLPRVIRVWGSYNSRSGRVCQPVESVGVVSRVSYIFNQTSTTKKTEAKLESSEVEQKFTRLCKSNKRLREISNGEIAFPSRSEADFEFVAMLAKAHFTESDIEELWSHNPSGHEKPKKGDIQRIVGKISKDIDAKSFSLATNSRSYYDTLKERRMGIRTGFNTLDEMISGLKDGKLILIGARPGTGKTTFVTQMLTNIAEKGIPCLFFPTEVGAEPIIDKIVSRKCEIALKKFQNGTFTETDVSKIAETESYIKSLPLVIYEDFGLNVDKYEQEIDKHAPRVVCLDYFQALKWEDPASLGEKEEAVRRIKKITKDRGITTICLSQLNRASQGTGGKASLSELKGTAALEELGDVIIQMYLSDEVIQHPKIVDLVVTKSKYSATGNIILKFDRTMGKFWEDESNDTRSA